MGHSHVVCRDTNLDTYCSKLMSAERAADLVPDQSKLLLPFGPGIPPAICGALGSRAERGGFTSLHLTYCLATPALGETLLRPELQHIVEASSPFIGAVERGIRNPDRRGHVQFLPIFFHQYPEVLANHIGFDTFALQVSPMDRHGYFSVGTGHDYAADLVQRVPRIIVEVNPKMPRTFGDGFVHVSQVAAIVENESELADYPLKPIGEVERMIAEHVVNLIPDRATVQLGLGSIPDAVCEALVNHRDLGLHSELISPAVGRLIESGAVTNKYKSLQRHKSVFTLMLADRAAYDLVDDNPAVEGYSVAYVNNPTVIAQFENFVSINGVLQIDLTGQANSEMIGGRQFSAVGGQTDFIRGARGAKNGVSILATRSTSANGASKVVPLIQEVVTDTRMDTQYVVTEYGAVNLLGKTCRERALALIEIAHPESRDELLRQAIAMGIVA